MPRAQDPDRVLADHLLSWHTPLENGTAEKLDAIRARFKALANFVIKSAPPSDDRTAAVKALGDASRAAIFAVVANQYDEPAGES